MVLHHLVANLYGLENLSLQKKMRFWLKIPLTGLIDQVDEGRCYGLDTSSGSGSMGSSSGYGSTGFEPNLDDTLG